LYQEGESQGKQACSLADCLFQTTLRKQRGNKRNKQHLFLTLPQHLFKDKTANHHRFHVYQVKYEEAFLSGSRLNIIMEYCPKRDLRYYITRGAQGKISSIPEDCCWRLLLQMCQ
jgi:serine/threonine protein kinase